MDFSETEKYSFSKIRLDYGFCSGNITYQKSIKYSTDEISKKHVNT